VRSAYNSARGFRVALEDLLQNLRASWVLLSCSSEGYLDPGEVPELLLRWGRVDRIAFDFKRYVGAQIGIHNPRGEKVGRVSHLRNREYLYLAGPDRAALQAALHAASEAMRLAPGGALVVRDGRETDREAARG
jgi:adenine-specific DNA-methyltransferase